MRSALLTLLVIASVLTTSAQEKTKDSIFSDLCSSALMNVVALTAKANTGDSEAQYEMGMATLGLAKPTPDALSKAMVWFRKAAEQGHAKAQDEVGGLNFDDGGDWRQAAFWFSEAAKQGNDDAQLLLGTMYEQGRGVGQDKVEALKWYRLSAKQGNPDAEVSLGQMYEEGEVVRQDYSLAAKWYRKAADQFPDRGGVGAGRVQLANLYREGRLPSNYVDAYMWFAIVGSVDDMKDAGRHMTRFQIAEAQRRARKWVKTHPDTDECVQQKRPTP